MCAVLGSDIITLMRKTCMKFLVIVQTTGGVPLMYVAIWKLYKDQINSLNDCTSGSRGGEGAHSARLP